MAIPAKATLGNPNVTEGNFQVAIEQLRESVIGSGKEYDSTNTYMQYDTCVYSGVTYYSKINSNTGNTPAIGTNWGDIADLISSVVHKTGDETIAGVKTFSSSPIVPVPTLVNQAISMGNIIEKTGVGLGYGTGSGGTVTQLTSKSTTVTLNKPSGRIVTHNSSLAAGATVVFQVNNSLILTTETVNVILVDNANYDVKSGWNTNGAFTVKITNTTGSPLSEVLNIHFNIVKGAIS